MCPPSPSPRLIALFSILSPSPNAHAAAAAAAVAELICIALLKGTKYPSFRSSILTNVKSIETATLIWKWQTQAQALVRAQHPHASFIQRSVLHTISPISARLSQQTHTGSVMMAAATLHTRARVHAHTTMQKSPLRTHKQQLPPPRLARSNSGTTSRSGRISPGSPDPQAGATDRGATDYPNSCLAHLNKKTNKKKKKHTTCEKTALRPLRLDGTTSQ